MGLLWPPPGSLGYLWGPRVLRKLGRASPKLSKTFQIPRKVSKSFLKSPSFFSLPKYLVLRQKNHFWVWGNDRSWRKSKTDFDHHPSLFSKLSKSYLNSPIVSKLSKVPKTFQRSPKAFKVQKFPKLSKILARRKHACGGWRGAASDDNARKTRRV